jgi:hypothetical protein
MFGLDGFIKYRLTESASGNSTIDAVRRKAKEITKMYR